MLGLCGFQGWFRKQNQQLLGCGKRFLMIKFIKTLADGWFYYITFSSIEADGDVNDLFTGSNSVN